MQLIFYKNEEKKGRHDPSQGLKQGEHMYVWKFFFFLSLFLFISLSLNA
jgi:hypothetical protein